MSDWDNGEQLENFFENLYRDLNESENPEPEKQKLEEKKDDSLYCSCLFPKIKIVNILNNNINYCELCKKELK